jgi:hypothetical protein
LSMSQIFRFAIRKTLAPNLSTFSGVVSAATFNSKLGASVSPGSRPSTLAQPSGCQSRSKTLLLRLCAYHGETSRISLDISERPFSRGPMHNSQVVYF